MAAPGRCGRGKWNNPHPTDYCSDRVTIMIFASSGYRAPLNIIAITSFISASPLISRAIFLILDMDAPTTNGFVQLSNEPFKRALAELER